jgi:nucleoside-diphosphate-sugar epimerase
MAVFITGAGGFLGQMLVNILNADIMAVVSGYKEWSINCDRAAREIGWTSSYSVEKMADDIIVNVRAAP